MKYNAPYGVSDPNAAYINGNPSTGTMGSIPPAASIEYPQREIVSLIADAGMTPDNADLAQLAKGVQGGRLVYGVDTGTANAYSINVSPTLAAYAAGQRWTVKIGNSNTGPSTININALGARHIVYPQGGEMIGGELLAGGIVTLVDDGVHLQLQNVTTGVGQVTGGWVFLTAPKDYYVNGTTGDDTLYDGSQATVGVGKKGPFKTIQKPLDQVPLFNLNGSTITIHVADGTYNQSLSTRTQNGAGYVAIIGNHANPQNCTINAVGGITAVACGSGTWFWDGFQIIYGTGAPAAGSSGDCIGVGNGSLSLGNIILGSAYRAQLVVGALGFMSLSPLYGTRSTITISIGSTASFHMLVQNSGTIQHSSDPALAPQLVINGAVAFSGAFACASLLGEIAVVYNSISGAAFVSGSKYNVFMNGIVWTGGAGVNYYPGSAAGSVSLGGQYG
jgi:hypothetical protein